MELSPKGLLAALAELLNNELVQNARRGILRAHGVRYSTVVPSSTTYPDAKDGECWACSNGKFYYKANGTFYSVTGV